MQRAKKTIKSLIWYVTALPIGLVASLLLIVAAFIEAMLRQKDQAWNPWNPFRDHATQPINVPLPRPVLDMMENQVMLDADSQRALYDNLWDMYGDFDDED